MTKWERGVVLGVSVALAAVTSALGQEAAPYALGDSAADLVYTPVTPCRVIDTRLAGGTLAGGTQRSFFVSGTAGFETQGGHVGGCAVPDGTTAVMLNFVAVNAAGAGDLRAWPYGQPVPVASILNYALVPGLNIANGVVVPLCDTTVSACPFHLTVQADVSTTHIIADVLGFMRAVAPQAVTTSLLADGAVSAAKLGNNSVDSLKIVDGSVGAADVNEAEVQLRVGSACAAGSSIRSIAANGTVVCQPDTNSGGTVTSITAGSGLQGGTITGSGTISVDFAGSGSANTAARSDHAHAVTRTKSISAMACIGLGAPAGEASQCSGGFMLRTDGDQLSPCVLNARTTRDTYVCELDLPSGAQITNITAYGYDSVSNGYMEALVWRFLNNSFGASLFSNFGGTWQSSGVAFAGGDVNFPIFNAATPHTVQAGYRYVIGLGLKAPTGGNMWAYGFQVTYIGP
jgi:hypothetical protein